VLIYQKLNRLYKPVKRLTAEFEITYVKTKLQVNAKQIH